MGRCSDARERLIEAAAELFRADGYHSASVEAMCRKAGVQKGSFYHFFESKCDLAGAALDYAWAQQEARLRRDFASAVPPVERLIRHFDAVYREQLALRARHGRTLGCPFYRLGTECSGVYPEIAARIETIIAAYRGYFERALRAAGGGKPGLNGDPLRLAHWLFALYQGLLEEARICDDPEILRQLPAAVARLLGGGRVESAAALPLRRGDDEEVVAGGGPVASVVD